LNVINSMKIEKLNWDSEFFGLKIGRIIINKEKEFDWYGFKKAAYYEKYELIYVFTFQNMLSKEMLLKAELDLVDIHFTMTKKFKKEDFLNITYDFRTELNEKDKQECYRIAEETSIVSRFYKENKMGPIITKELYRKWIDNALNKSFSDGLFLEKVSNSVSGIHLIKTDVVNKIGYFTLTGVGSNNKRKGVGSKLWMQSFAYWANESEIEIIKSPFSFQNPESFNFHLRMGFDKIEETKYIYHFRNTFV
jgi:dTDP-4-amino-4,6-dideoxy-D-galactose acyltransferase